MVWSSCKIKGLFITRITELREQNCHASTGMWEAAVERRELSPVLCDDLEGWDGVCVCEGGSEGGDIYIHIADSCCCTEKLTIV